VQVRYVIDNGAQECVQISIRRSTAPLLHHALHQAPHSIDRSMADADISTHSSIQVITRHDRSLYTRIIHLVTSPLREYLIRPGKEQPTGSVKLTPHKSAYKGCAVAHRKVCDMHVYDIISTAPATQHTCKRIYYFCGGGWQSPPSSQHWHNLAKVNTPGCSPAYVAKSTLRWPATCPAPPSRS